MDVVLIFVFIGLVVGIYLLTANRKKSPTIDVEDLPPIKRDDENIRIQ